MWFILLSMVVANNTATCIRASLWDIQFLDEETGVSAFVLTNTLDRPSSLAKLQVQMSQYLGILMSWQYLSVLPFSLLVMALMKQLKSAPRTYVQTAIA